MYHRVGVCPRRWVSELSNSLGQREREASGQHEPVVQAQTFCPAECLPDGLVPQLTHTAAGVWFAH